MKHLDKLLHGLGGLVIQIGIGILTHPALGLLAVVVVAWLKEEYDYTHPEAHTKDGWDAFATATGAAVGQIVLWQVPTFL